MRLIIIAAPAFLLPVVSSAQTSNPPAGEPKCTAAMAKSLTIRGIHPGMNTIEFLQQ